LLCKGHADCAAFLKFRGVDRDLMFIFLHHGLVVELFGLCNQSEKDGSSNEGRSVPHLIQFEVVVGHLRKITTMVHVD
jgi:hypothetical protein